MDESTPSESSAPSMETHIAELTSDAPATGQPETEPIQAQSEEPQGATPPEAAVESEPAPAQPAAPTPTQPTVPPFSATVRGQRFNTREQLIEALSKDDGLLRNLVAAAEQFPYLQEKYYGVLDEVARRQGAQQPAPEAPARPQISPKMVADWAAPRIQQLAEEGLIEREAAEFYPNLVSQGLLMAQVARTALEKVERLERQSQGSVINSFLQQHDAVLSDIAGSHELFAPLRDPQAREAFKDFLASEVNPPIERANDPDFLKGQWLAFQKQLLLAGPAPGARSATAARQTQKRNAAGDSPRTRPAQGKPLDEREAHIESLLADGPGR